MRILLTEKPLTPSQVERALALSNTEPSACTIIQWIKPSTEQFRSDVITRLKSSNVAIVVVDDPYEYDELLVIARLMTLYGKRTIYIPYNLVTNNNN